MPRKYTKKKKEEKPRVEDLDTEYKKPSAEKPFSFGILRNRERNIKKYYGI